jgi:hypothetical protein
MISCEARDIFHGNVLHLGQAAREHLGFIGKADHDPTLPQNPVKR